MKLYKTYENIVVNEISGYGFTYDNDLNQMHWEQF